jgi:hypothetical protein
VIADFGSPRSWITPPVKRPVTDRVKHEQIARGPEPKRAAIASKAGPTLVESNRFNPRSIKMKAIAIASALTLAFAAACGGGTPEAETPADESAEAPAEEAPAEEAAEEEAAEEEAAEEEAAEEEASEEAAEEAGEEAAEGAAE